jgi:hypothetical protein
MTPDNPKMTGGRAVTAVITFILLYIGFSKLVHWQAASDMSTIQQQVANDAVDQYNIAKANGSAMDAFVHAQLAAEGFLQAKDEANYQKWKAIERQEARRAGVSAFAH